MASFVEVAANAALADTVIFTFQPTMFPSTLPATWYPKLLETEYSAAASALMQLYLAPSGVNSDQNRIMIINDTLQWASRGCRRVPRNVAAPIGTPWELRATRAVVTNSFFRFWWEPGGD